MEFLLNLLNVLIILGIIGLSVYIGLNRAKLIGIWGEKEVSTILKLLNKNYKVYNDIYVPTKNGTNQIDHVIISQYGIFVIETKNYKGWIYGKEDNPNWTQNIFGKKYNLLNPILQNRSHIKALKHIFPYYSCNKYISIIVFTRAPKIKVKLNTDHHIIYLSDLIPCINKYNEQVFTDEQVVHLCETLEKELVNSPEIKKQHIEYVQNNKIRQFNLSKSGTCPICGGKLIQRNGKYGSFYGCSNYPKCKYTKKKNNETII